MIDAHTHAWGPDVEPYRWEAEVLPPGWSGEYTHEELIADMDEAGVDEAVVVTTPLYGRGPGANDYTEAAIGAHPDRLYGVGITDYFPDESPPADERVRDILASERMLGVRVHAALAYDPIPTALDRDGDWFRRIDEAVFRAVADADGAVFVFPKAQQLPDVERMVGAYPDVQFVIDHMAWPDETTAPNSRPWTAFESLAKHGNVAVKVSSLPRSATEPWPYPDLHEYVRLLVEWFGPERLMLGSDYPWMDDWADYGECLSWLGEVPFLSKQDRRYIRERAFRCIHSV